MNVSDSAQPLRSSAHIAFGRRFLARNWFSTFMSSHWLIRRSCCHGNVTSRCDVFVGPLMLHVTSQYLNYRHRRKRRHRRWKLSHELIRKIISLLAEYIQAKNGQGSVIKVKHVKQSQEFYVLFMFQLGNKCTIIKKLLMIKKWP